MANSESSIESEIEGLIFDCECKITDCRKLLDTIRIKSRIAKRDGDSEKVAILRIERATQDARIHAYMQSKSDLDTLLDYV